VLFLTLNARFLQNFRDPFHISYLSVSSNSKVTGRCWESKMSKPLYFRPNEEPGSSGLAELKKKKKKKKEKISLLFPEQWSLFLSRRVT
jgi:hypothetical protein